MGLGGNTKGLKSVLLVDARSPIAVVPFLINLNLVDKDAEQITNDEISKFTHAIDPPEKICSNNLSSTVRWRTSLFRKKSCGNR